MRAVVVLSGGQDSTTCLYWAKARYKEVHAITFDYGQRNRIEIEHAERIAKDAGADTWTRRDLRGVFVNNATAGAFVPGRNIVFLSIAAAHAVQMGCDTIITGAGQTDYSGYPDCHRSTMDALETTLTLGLGAGRIHIITPLMELTKAQTWKLAKELGCLDIIINDTITDYGADMTMNEWGRGNPDDRASKLRAQGYYEAKAKNWI